MDIRIPYNRLDVGIIVNNSHCPKEFFLDFHLSGKRE